MEVIDEKLKSWMAVKANPFKFFVHCKINDANKHAIVTMVLWPHLMLLVRLFESKQKMIILKARQIGVSYIIAFYALWKAMTNDAFRAIIISAGELEAQEFLSKVKFAYKNLPDWMREIAPLVKETESVLEFKVGNSTSKIEALPSTKKAGIGVTVSLVIIDEWDWHPFPDSDWAAAEPTASGGGQIIGVSTNNGDNIESFFKDMYRDAGDAEKESLNGFWRIFLGWYVRPDRNYNWYIEEEKAYLAKPHEFLWNHPTTEQQALSPLVGRTFFNQNRDQGRTLIEILEGCRPPIMQPDNFTQVWQPYAAGRAYVAAVDVSEGRGKDYQSLVILSKYGTICETAAVIHTNNVRIDTFAYLIYELCKQYAFPQLAVEKNAMGISCIERLEDLHYPRMFYENEKKENAGESGIATTRWNREPMLVELAAALARGELIPYCKEAVLQMFEFQWTKERKIKSVGKHDDLVLALAFAYHLVKRTPVPMRPTQANRLVERRTGVLGASYGRRFR